MRGRVVIKNSMSKKKAHNALQSITDHIDMLTYVLGMCDPRMSNKVCQFCKAKDGESHTADCIYLQLTEK